ncbi:MAG: hypothetical protein AAF821_13100 [Cyanobacteria bacterium P01_D01_bin.156]
MVSARSFMLTPNSMADHFNHHPPNVMEVQSSMCHIFQPQKPLPIARWILEEGQLLGVLIAKSPAPS